MPVLREDNLSFSNVGIRIGVSKSTASREVRLSRTTGDYSVVEAQWLSNTR